MGALWKKITKHPLITGFLALLALIGTYWSLFTDKKIPTFLEDNWWVLAMIPWYYTIVGAVGVTAVILYAILIRDVRRKWRAVGWLEAIADDDDRHMENRIQVCQLGELGGPPARPHLTGVEPYIELRVLIQNNTVYPLTFDHLEGKFHLYNSPFHMVPQVANKTFSINRIRPYRLKLLQPIQTTTAERIRNEGKAVIAGGKVTVHCTYKNRAGEIKPARIFLEGLTFLIVPE
jgi:hypothetical protein